ncbi:uncharacterized protein [Nicotiana sylvestris]|uniref:uncharacterized protein n=1 Tax=Nicotiana sylvestris TaxID=4096 RepID=UPI00388C3CF5
MYDFITAEDSELWDVICDGPFIPIKTTSEPLVIVPKLRKEYNDADRKVIQKNFRAKNILICGIGPDEYNRISAYQYAKEIWEALQTAHEGTTQVKQLKIDMLTTEEKLFRKILSVLHGSWERKVNAIIEAKDLQKLTIDEHIGNLKSYEMKKNKEHERRETKKEKNQGDSPSESGEDDEQGDTSRMVVESEATKYDSIFALMAKSDEDEDDDDDKGAVKQSVQRWYMDSGYSKHMTGSADDFLSLKTLQRGSVSFCNGKKGYILGVGRAGKTPTHSIENVYYVNSFKYSLLSVSRKRKKVEFLSKTCTVTNLIIGEVVLMTKRFKNMYVANFESLNNGNLTCLSVVDD